MPTKEDFQKLINRTEHSYVTNWNNTGMNGYVFTNKSDPSKSIFLPSAGDCNNNNSIFTHYNEEGCYWSSTYYGNVDEILGYRWQLGACAYYLPIKSEYTVQGWPFTTELSVTHLGTINSGHSIRPIYVGE